VTLLEDCPVPIMKRFLSASKRDGRLPQDERGWRVAPAPDGRGMPDPPPVRPPHRSRWFLWLVGGLLVVNFGSALILQPAGQPRVPIPFSPYFVTAVRAGRVLSIASKGDTIQGTFRVAVRYPAQNPQIPRTKLFSTEVPTFWNNDQLAALLQAHHVQINASSPNPSTSVLGALLFGFGPTLLFVGLFIVVARRLGRGGGGSALGNFGRSQARRVDPATIRVTFDDVAGIDEAKADLTEIVEFLRSPQRYGRLGGRMPHGVLLSGAPGTGKTLLARAVAGEANAAFFSISASEFIEAIVGVGASRVRDLFAKAKHAAPSIIFIDELDAIGRSRQGLVSIAGGNDEREQTLDQVLTEMDGFESVEAVVVLAATNRPEILDHALLRPGRFDRRVAVQPPDRAPQDFGRSHAVDPVGRHRRPRRARRKHARDGRGRPCQSGQRSGVARGPARSRTR
jgi:cell division protease FtsH